MIASLELSQSDDQRLWYVTWKNIWNNLPEIKSFSTKEKATAFKDKQQKILEKEIEYYDRVQDERNHPEVCRDYTCNELCYMYLESSSDNFLSREAMASHVAAVCRMYGAKKISELTKEDIMVFCTLQRIRGVGQTTIARRITIFKSVLNWCVNRNKISHNPIVSLHVPKGKAPEIIVPTEEEIKAMLAVAPDLIKRVLLIGLYTGARIGPCELFRLKWEDVDIENRIIHMPAALKGITKVKSRAIPMRDDLVPTLWTWRSQDTKDGIPYVFHNTNGTPVSNIASAWARTIKSAGITRRITPYSLRHAFATYGINNGADTATISRLMGHKDLSMVLKVYHHPNKQLAKNAVNLLPSGLSKTIPVNGWV